MNFVKKVCNNARLDKGVTMLEMLLVLSIIAVLLILATRYYMSTSYSQKVNQLQQEVHAIRAATSNWKLGNPTLAGLNISALYASGYLAKADLNADQSAALTPWGETISVVQAQVGTIGYATITYTANGAGAAACKTVAAAIKANLSDSDTTTNATCDNGTFTYTFAP